MIEPIGADYQWTDSPKVTTFSNELYVRYPGTKKKKRSINFSRYGGASASWPRGLVASCPRCPPCPRVLVSSLQAWGSTARPSASAVTRCASGTLSRTRPTSRPAPRTWPSAGGATTLVTERTPSCPRAPPPGRPGPPLPLAATQTPCSGRERGARSQRGQHHLAVQSRRLASKQAEQALRSSGGVAAGGFSGNPVDDSFHTEGPVQHTCRQTLSFFLLRLGLCQSCTLLKRHRVRRGASPSPR